MLQDIRVKKVFGGKREREKDGNGKRKRDK